MKFNFWASLSVFVCSIQAITSTQDITNDSFNFNDLPNQLQDDIFDRYMKYSKGSSMHLHRVNREFWDKLASRNQVLKVDFKQTGINTIYSRKLCNVLALKKEAIFNHLEVAFKSHLQNYLNCLKKVETLRFDIEILLSFDLVYPGMTFCHIIDFTFLNEMKFLENLEAFFYRLGKGGRFEQFYFCIFQRFLNNLPDSLKSLTLAINDPFSLHQLSKHHFKPLNHFKIVTGSQFDYFPSYIQLPNLDEYFLLFEKLKVTNADILVNTVVYFLGRMENIESKFHSNVQFDKLGLHIQMNRPNLEVSLPAFANLVNQLKVENLKLYLDYSLGGSILHFSDILHFKQLNSVDLKVSFMEKEEISHLIDSMKRFEKRDLFDHVYLEFHYFEEGDLIKLAHNLAYKKLIVSSFILPEVTRVFCKEFYQLKDQGFSIALSKYGDQCISLSQDINQ